MANKVLIKNGLLWDGESFSKKDILSHGEVIEKIEDNITEDSAYTFDAEGKIVTPGLIDIHTHLSGYYGAIPDLATFPFGVTAAADSMAEPFSAHIFENLTLKTKVFITVEIKDNKAYFDNVKKQLEHYGDRVLGLKVFLDKGSDPSLKDETPLKEVCEFAKAHNLSVMVHTTNSPVSMQKIAETLNTGDIITHAYHGGANTALDDKFESLKFAKEKGITVDAGIEGQIHTNYKIFESAIKEGAFPDTISTDLTHFSSFKKGGRYGLTMCMSIARTLGMEESDILKTVTSNPAKALNMADEWGHLKVGRCADIAVLEYQNEPFDITDHFKNRVKSDFGYRCKLTVANGRVVYKD